MRRGTRVGQAYIAVTADGDGINEDIVDAVDEAGPGVEKAGREHGERYNDGFEESSRGRLGKMFDKVSDAARERFGKSGEESGKGFSKGLEGHFDNDYLDRLGARVGGHFVDALNFALSKEGGKNPLSDLFDKWMKEAVSGNGKSGGLGGGRGGESIGDRIGLMFGSKSRNNAIHVFGGLIGKTTDLVQGMFNIMGKSTQVFSVFGRGMASVGEDATRLQRILGGFSEVGAAGLGGISKGLSSLVASGPGAVVAIVAVGVALTGLISIVGSLIGIVTALAATITAALVGSLAVLGGAIAAVTAAAGLLVVAFTSMTDAQRKVLSDAFQPLKAELTGIGQILLEQMVPAFATWSANLQKALLLTVPVAQVMGQAFAQAGNILTASFSGPGFQMFAQAMGVYLPSIVTRLSTALGAFLNGTLGLFAALTPQVTRFAQYLSDVSTRFSNWATSAQGQNSISDFVDRSIVSLKSLWGAVGAFGGFLKAVLFSPQAMNAGNQMFDGIKRAFQSFTKTVQRAAADGSLQRWFDDAIRFGSALWSVITALGGTFLAFYNSGVITAIAGALGFLGQNINMVNAVLGPMVNGFGSALVGSLRAVLNPLNTLRAAIVAVGESIKWVLHLAGLAGKADFSKVGAAFNGGSAGYNPSTMVMGPVAYKGSSTPTFKMPKIPKMPSLSQLQSSGNSALNATSIDNGGYKAPAGGGAKKAWKNPWTAYANRLIKDGPSIASQVKTAMLNLNKLVADGLQSIVTDSVGASAARAALTDLQKQVTSNTTAMVDIAQQAANSAASALASASSPKEAKAAMKQVQKTQNDLQKALNNKASYIALNRQLSVQKIVRSWNLTQLANGVIRSNTTMAELAVARERVAVKLEAAQQKLTDALTLRDDTRTQVTQAAQSFASLASAQAQTIDGIEQALTSNDINSNLQTKLDQINKFNDDLKLLAAEGLSDAAYKQILDQGVDAGQKYADALLAGGVGAIQQTNGLVAAVDAASAALGADSSARLYQAGVDAAQGLVDGLTSLSDKLDAAATQLGNSIAKAVERSLGIHSPSRRLREMMGSVGDGAVLGLDDQHVKVGTAAAALADLIAVNPGGPPANGGPPRTEADPNNPVSGNAKIAGDVTLVVHTPTEDPKAVATEAINELVGRL